MQSCSADTAEDPGGAWEFETDAPDEMQPPRAPQPKIEAGAEHTCVLWADGSVQCWGIETASGIALAEPDPRFINDVEVAEAIDLALGVGISCVAHVDGTASCWGDVGPDFVDFSERHIPQAIEGIENATDVEVLGAWLSSCYLVGDRVDCTSLEDETVIRELRPTVSITSALWHMCAVHADGNTTCWEGDGDPLDLHGDRDDVVTLFPGYPSCAQHADGSVTCLDGTVENGLLRKVVPGLRDPLSVKSGWGVTCAVTREGTLWCWGDRGYDLESPDPIVPREIPGTRNLVDVAVGESHICTLDADGGIECWGENDTNQLGDFGVANRFP